MRDSGWRVRISLCWSSARSIADGAIEQGLDAAGPEGLPEDGAGAQHLARLGRHAIEAELHQRLHGERELFAAVGGAADQLFEEERVAPGAADDVGAHRRIAARERGGDEALGRERARAARA